jgi:hypothetical protein
MGDTNITMLVYLALLFFALTPGQLLTLPSVDSPKINVVIVHAIAFAVVWHFTHKMVESSTIQLKL